MTQKPDTASKLGDSDEWSTPRKLFQALSKRYGFFDLDICSTPANALCPWRLPNALSLVWWSLVLLELGPEARAFMNPPYSRGNLMRFMTLVRALVLAKWLRLVTCVVPACLAEGWWQDTVEAAGGALISVTHAVTELGPATQWRYSNLTIEVVRPRGRARFIEASGATGPARFSIAYVTFAQDGVLPMLGVVPLKRGPKPVVTPELELAMEGFLSQGLSIVQACVKTGIARKTWYRFLERRKEAA